MTGAHATRTDSAMRLRIVFFLCTLPNVNEARPHTHNSIPRYFDWFLPIKTCDVARSIESNLSTKWNVTENHIEFQHFPSAVPNFPFLCVTRQKKAVCRWAKQRIWREKSLSLFWPNVKIDYLHLKWFSWQWWQLTGDPNRFKSNERCGQWKYSWNIAINFLSSLVIFFSPESPLKVVLLHTELFYRLLRLFPH